MVDLFNEEERAVRRRGVQGRAKGRDERRLYMGRVGAIVSIHIV